MESQLPVGLGVQDSSRQSVLEHGWEDPKSRSLKGVPRQDPLVARVLNQGIYFLDPPGGLGKGCVLGS